MTDYPIVRLLERRHGRVAKGYPWVFSNEVAVTPELKEIEPGALVRVEAANGEGLGLAFYNRHSLIAGRLVSRSVKSRIDSAFIEERLRQALALRERFFAAPYYRLCHAEADGLPGTIVDRYGQVLVVQINTAGMERLSQDLVAALDRLLAPEAILLKNDSALRTLEGLDMGEEVAKGAVAEPVPVEENGVRYFADLRQGQKTGWFYDQRDNRAWIRRFAEGQSVFDGYCYSGGFAMQAAAAGASKVLAVDRSESALAMLARAAEANGTAGRIEALRADVFAELTKRGEAGERFGLVMVDPPAFIKAKKDLAQGLKGYRKLARLAAKTVAPGGILFVASCSHQADAGSFGRAVAEGLGDAGRTARLLKLSGAGPDHPQHPLLPESAYLKALTFALD